MVAFLRLFGGLRLETDEVALTARAIQKKRLALLALLGASPTGWLSRDKLTAYLWPESDADRARHQLASSVYELRKALGEDAIISAGDDLRLNPERLRSDVIEFDAAIAAGDRERAIGLYAGPFLDGFFVPEAAELEHWVDAERTRLAHAYAKALEQLAQERTDRGDRLGAVELWRKLAAHDLYNSRVALRLIRALDAAGDRAGALQHARTHTTLLREELDVEPDPAITALAEQLRALPVDALPLSAPVAIPLATSATIPVRPSSMVAPPNRSRPHALAVVVALGTVAIAGALLVIASDQKGESAQPVVVMMDSPHPSRVYDDETAQASGTNADILNDLLRDLPIQRVKETAGPLWHRHEEIRQLDPDLILIHLSAFCEEECEPKRVRMRRFIEYLADTDTKFLIYSRMRPDTLAVSYREMLGDLLQRHPKLAGRLHTFSLVEYGTPRWKDPATAAELKLRVKKLLELR